MRKKDGCLRCGHGDRIAEYLKHLLESNASDDVFCSQLIDALLELLSSRRTSNFAYASVYLLEGLCQAFENRREMRFSSQQLENLADLSTWAALPEVARDYIFVRCLKLCGDSSSRTAEGIEGVSVAKAIARWNRLQTLLTKQNQQNFPTGPIATWNADLSKRDMMEEATVERCHRLRQMLGSKETATAAEVETALADIWSDVEYLEYPKRILMELPGLILDVKLIKLALESESLGTSVAGMICKLRDLSGNRVYIMTPLMCAVRDTVLNLPIAADLFGLDDLVIHYSEALPEPTVDLQLEDATTAIVQSIAPEMETFNYEYYFGARETVGVAALLDIVSRLHMQRPGKTGLILDRLLQRWAEQKNPPPTVSVWKTTLQLQVMLLCCEQLPSQRQPLDLLKDLHYILSIEPLPRYRYLLGWIIARIYLKHESMRTRILDELTTKDHHSNPKYLASLMKIGVMLAKTESADAEFGLRLASTFVPLAASSKVVIRHEAQWQVPLLMDHARAQGWIAITENAAFVALDDYIRSLERFEQPPLERQFDRFDPIKDHTMTNLVEGPWYGLDNTESPRCGRGDFVKLYESDAGHDLPANCIPLGDPIVLPGRVNAAPTNRNVDNKQALAPSRAGESRALQTKGTAYLALEDAAHQQARRNELIVVASLVDNPYNLGGLSRVSEVFGASEMHLQNQNVTSNKDFSNVSVSSHLHFPIFQLSASAVPSYLAEKRNEGWSIVGIEQTDRSVLLGSEECKLPERIVLVIGSEKEGIPALVLSECNMLVEIPQQGTTRSLNVQTAAGIVLYEYARQHRTL